MAFHRICSCALGFRPNLRSDDAKNDFSLEISKLQEFLTDPWFSRVTAGGTVQIPVPKVTPPPPPPVVHANVADSAVASAQAGAEELLSAQTKRAALQRRAAVASMAAEDFARRFESGDLPDAPRDVDGEEQGLSTVNVMCRLCFCGENEGSERTKKMLSCKSCSKKYHRSCLNTWGQHRDLFHWSSWTCPSCRICEVCRRTGDPNKFKFCRRCDAAYHCYCMQPPHKNISSGPYLCPNHTRCHSCDSNVPGNGLSLRWFLGYTCCDACGRLFTKGNYCPVCLRVYRDSESTPMVCCDICQRWVHCNCDNISDEKYMRFQADSNLPYTCPTCRGECYQVKDMEDAVRELWRRRDEVDRDLISSLRDAAGLPTQEEIFSMTPFSDDEYYDPPKLKTDHGRVKLSLKGLSESSPKKSKDYGKKSSNKKKKKGYHMDSDSKVGSNPNFEGHQDAVSTGYGSSPVQDIVQSHKSGQEDLSPAERIHSMNEQGAVKQKSIDEIKNNGKRPGILQIKSRSTNNAVAGEDASKSTKKKAVKATKLVIHLGGRNRNLTNSPKSDSSSYLREQELPVLNGGEAVSQHREGERHSAERSDSAADHDEGYRIDSSRRVRGLKHREREGNVIRLGKGKTDVTSKTDQGNGTGINGVFSSGKKPNLLIKRSEGSTAAAGTLNSISKGDRMSLRKHPETKPDLHDETHKSDLHAFPTSSAAPKDSKPLLKLKFKTPYQGSWILHGEEEKGVVKGQRSKRKRPSEKVKSEEEEDGRESQQDNLMHNMIDDNWILKKFGKDAIGKRVEVQQQSDNSWQKGFVSDVIKGTSMLTVDLDDGRTKTVELGKQGIRLVPQKQKRQKL
ncbi:hypothetical protein V2J09_023292 [Rumex salicifolius]